MNPPADRPKPSRGEPRFVTAEPLSVAPALVGRRLAEPGRRAGALAIDLLLLALLANLGRWGLAAALLVLAWQVYLALGAEGARPVVARVVAAVLVLGALLLVWAELRPASDGSWQREARQAERRAQALRIDPEAAASAASAADEARQAVSRAVAEAGGGDNAARLAAQAVETALRAASRLPDVSGASAASAAEGDSREVQLDAALAELRRLRQDYHPPRWTDQIESGVRDLARGFGWGIVYFSLLPAFWQGRTVGKALLGLRIVELSGRPLTPLRTLKRYGGYAAGLATGGLGFVQVLWEPNRQALHDKAAHTVVLDHRFPPAADPAAPAEPAVPAVPAVRVAPD